MLSAIFKTFNSLGLVMKYIDSSYPIPGIEIKELNKKLNFSSGEILLYDVRKPEEYDISHLKKATPIHPETSVDEFVKQEQKNFENKMLVFYCSVGQRSSQFISAAQDACLENGAGGLYNLRGGIFKWYNEGNPVYCQGTITDKIHPYNEFWGHFIDAR